jgi:hypothetical protein
MIFNYYDRTPGEADKIVLLSFICPAIFIIRIILSKLYSNSAVGQGTPGAVGSAT